MTQALIVDILNAFPDELDNGALASASRYRKAQLVDGNDIVEHVPLPPATAEELRDTIRAMPAGSVVSFMSHGSPDAIHGPMDDPATAGQPGSPVAGGAPAEGPRVFGTEHVSGTMAVSKIFHFVACSCAMDLGRTLVSLKALAIMGYDGLYSLPVPDHSYFNDAEEGQRALEAFLCCDSAAIVSLLQGRRVAEAHKAALSCYKREIARHKKWDPRGELRKFLYGNMRRFVSPVNRDGLGTREARMGIADASSSA